MATNPIGRLDDAMEVSLDKFSWVLGYCSRNNYGLVIAGDFTDSPRSWELLSVLADMIAESGVSIFAVYGQHDTYKHNVKERYKTILGVLESSGLVTILDEEPKRIFPHLKSKINLYGTSYNRSGVKVPIPKKNIPGQNLLVIHAPIAKRALWHSHDYINAKKFLMEHKQYDLILCGDIHRRFFVRDKSNRIIVNTGPMFRKTADEYNFKHSPCFYLLNQNFALSKISIPHDPAKEVLSRNHIKIEKENRKALEDLMEELSVEAKEDFTVDLVANLFRMARDNNVEREVIEIIEDSLNRVSENE
jgi:hypothetical protein